MDSVQNPEYTCTHLYLKKCLYVVIFSSISITFFKSSIFFMIVRILSTTISRSARGSHNLIQLQKPAKKLERGTNLHTHVNTKWILLNCITYECVNKMYILHLDQFMRLRNPNLSVHVKWPKLTSIPPQVDQTSSNSAQMVTNRGVDMAEVCSGNHDSSCEHS